MFATLYIDVCELLELPTFILQIHDLADEIVGPNKALVRWWDCIYVFLGRTDGLLESAKGCDRVRRRHRNRLAADSFVRRNAELPIANLTFPEIN